MSDSTSWDVQFLALFDRCCGLYRGGNTDFDSYYSKEDLSFLASIGYKAREFFDFVEDYCDEGVPSPSMALLIAAARRDYFLTVQKSEASDNVIAPESFPGKSDETDGIPWLPRIVAKARAKLRGELDPNSMYSCGGDRAFLGRHDLHGGDFLRIVWAAGDDDSRITEYTKTGQW
jgi:hypothetical protein